MNFWWDLCLIQIGLKSGSHPTRQCGKFFTSGLGIIRFNLHFKKLLTYQFIPYGNYSFRASHVKRRYIRGLFAWLKPLDRLDIDRLRVSFQNIVDTHVNLMITKILFAICQHNTNDTACFFFYSLLFETICDRTF